MQKPSKWEQPEVSHSKEVRMPVRSNIENVKEQHQGEAETQAIGVCYNIENVKEQQQGEAEGQSTKRERKRPYLISDVGMSAPAPTAYALRSKQPCSLIIVTNILFMGSKYPKKINIILKTKSLLLTHWELR